MSTPTQSKSKLLILHENNIKNSDFLNITKVCPSTLADLRIFTSQALNNLFDRFDVILIDLSDKAQLAYYDTYKSSVTDNVTVVYLKRRGEHLDLETTKKTLLCDFARKYLPTDFTSLVDLISKLSSDHISSSIVSPRGGLLMKILRMIVKKLLG